jgi:hypothetical protein
MHVLQVAEVAQSSQLATKEEQLWQDVFVADKK